MDQIDGTAQSRQINRILQSGVATPYHDSIAAAVEGTVADGAVGDPHADQFLFPGKIQAPVEDAGGKDDGLGRKLFFAVDDKNVILLFQATGLGVFKRNAQLGDLLLEILGKIRAGDTRQGRIVFH